VQVCLGYLLSKVAPAGLDRPTVGRCSAGTRPTLTFNHFHTEERFDFVDVFNGAASYGGLNTQSGSHFSGILAPGSMCLRAANQRMDVRFTSDHSITRRGFYATYICTPELDTSGNCSTPQQQHASAAACSVTQPLQLNGSSGVVNFWWATVLYVYAPGCAPVEPHKIARWVLDTGGRI
jgi:hypothetical protein